MERAERHFMRRLRSGHSRFEEGILFGTYNRIHGQRAEGNYGEGVSVVEQAAGR